MPEKLFIKAVQMGLGVVDLTREQTEKFVKDFAKKNNLTVKESRKTAQKLLDEAKQARKKLNKHIDLMVNKALTKSGVATKKDIERLEKKIAASRSHPPKNKKKTKKRSP